MTPELRKFGRVCATTFKNLADFAHFDFRTKIPNTLSPELIPDFLKLLPDGFFLPYMHMEEHIH